MATRIWLVIAVFSIGCKSGPPHSLSPRIPSPINEPCKLTGVVLDMENHPIPGATLIFDNERVVALAENDGRFAIERIPADTTLTVFASGRRLEYPAAELTCTQPLTIRIDIRVDDNGNPVPQGEV